MELQPRFSEEEVLAAVRRLADRISEDYRGRRPLLVGALKGCFVFLADLVRELRIPFEVEFVRARSYGSARESSGPVEITKDVECELHGRDVIVIEDILDSGRTMDTLVKRIEAGGPASVRRCALLVREGRELPDYWGLKIGPGFVVGYGIDYAEQYRGLRDVRALPSEEG